ncbi:hypothetical protein ABEB36_011581 [Hypothenemus hampei]|uniref:Death domain-containing protein n=1 Tax=Hypothenemus hampei TaxID=57062 RepID=A0ABD1E973_HYPHA
MSVVNHASCPGKGASLKSTPEELERRAIIQRNDLLLHEAVIKNDTEGVRKWLREPVEVNSRNNYGRAPIHWAAARGNLEIMNILIKAQCDLQAKDKYGMQPLHMAAWHGHSEAVRVLINLGVSTHAVTKSQYTLLICAARNNHEDVIDYLLDTLEDVQIDAADEDGQTAVFHAASNGHVAIVRRLVEAGASLEKPNKENRTALHEAARNGHVEVAELLLMAKEIDIEAADSLGCTPLHLAAQYQQDRMVDILLENNANIDSQNQKGNTALHIAASLGSKGIVECLLLHGASMALQNHVGNTALHVASQSNEIEIVNILINRGADVNYLNNRLQTPIHIAAEMGHQEVCRLLLSAGADIQQRERGGRTPLYIAARGSFTAIVDMIIKTARVECPTHDQDGKLKLKLSRRWRSTSKDEGKMKEYERLKEILYKLAYKHLEPGDWKRLALHWSFTEEQIKAIEHQYNGPSSYKEHGFRMMLIWAYCLTADMNPIKELYESLVAIGKKSLADTLRKKIEQENESGRKSDQKCNKCIIC